MFPIIPANTAAASFPENDEGIFYGGNTNNTPVAITNLVSNAGVVATDTAALGSASQSFAGTEYGGDKGIFGFGYYPVPYSRTNLVSNAGVVSTDVTGVGTARYGGGACGYGGDKGIFGFGSTLAVFISITNLVSNAGVVATDQAATTGTARINIEACEYGGDKGIFGFGYIAGVPYGVSTTNLVSNAGVVSSDVAGAGTARWSLAACSYGGDKGIFGFGCKAVGHDVSPPLSMTNLISNAGVVATDVAGVGTARRYLPATQYGGDKGIFGFGTTDGKWDTVGMTNLVSNTGVVATDVSAVGTDRYSLAACSFN